ncbi:MAG: hypothetical protein L3J57_08285 [Desulfuromusa sp.]|nr:hypothetical protein [Desulfuromusa sp.]
MIVKRIRETDGFKPLVDLLVDDDLLRVETAQAEIQRFPAFELLQQILIDFLCG